MDYGTSFLFLIYLSGVLIAYYSMIFVDIKYKYHLLCIFSVPFVVGTHVSFSVGHIHGIAVFIIIFLLFLKRAGSIKKEV